MNFDWQKISMEMIVIRSLWSRFRRLAGGSSGYGSHFELNVWSVPVSQRFVQEVRKYLAIRYRCSLIQWPALKAAEIKMQPTRQQKKSSLQRVRRKSGRLLTIFGEAEESDQLKNVNIRWYLYLRVHRFCSEARLKRFGHADGKQGGL